MKKIILIIALLGFWQVAAAYPRLLDYHTNQMVADIAASDVIAIVTVKAVSRIQTTNSTGQQTTTYTFDVSLERTLKGSLISEKQIVLRCSQPDFWIESVYRPYGSLPMRSICFLKKEANEFAPAIRGFAFRQLMGETSGRFDWRSKYPSIEELESILKLTSAK